MRMYTMTEDVQARQRVSTVELKSVIKLFILHCQSNIAHYFPTSRSGGVTFIIAFATQCHSVCSYQWKNYREKHPQE